MVGLRKDCSREASGRSPCRGVCKGLLHVGKAEDATNEIREKEGVENGWVFYVGRMLHAFTSSKVLVKA